MTTPQTTELGEQARGEGLAAIGTHEVIPAALTDYCEAIRQSRLGWVRGNAEMFEAVVKDACAIPPGTPITLKQIITDAVKRTVDRCGGSKIKAAKVLKCSPDTVYSHMRKVVSV